MTDALSVRDTVVMPMQDILAVPRGGSDHKGGPIWPDWEAQSAARHCRGGVPVDTRPDLPAEVLQTLDRAVWIGPLVNHFGHQIADFSSRILLSRAQFPAVPLLCACLAGREHLLTEPGFVRAILDWLGAGEVTLARAPTLVRQLHVIPQQEQLPNLPPTGAYLDALDALQAQRLPAATIAPDGPPLYVSRAGQRIKIAGEAYIETVISECGGKVLRPETLALPEQLRCYASARRILFSEGSALHGLQLLGRNPWEIGVLTRRAGSRVAKAALTSRARAVRYFDVTKDLICPRNRRGRRALPVGISLADEAALLIALDGTFPGLRAIWSPARFREARQRDILAWVKWVVRTGRMQGRDDLDYLRPQLDVHLQGPNRQLAEQMIDAAATDLIR